MLSEIHVLEMVTRSRKCFEKLQQLHFIYIFFHRPVIKTSFVKAALKESGGRNCFAAKEKS